MYADRRDAGAGAQLSSSRGRRDGGAGAHLPRLKGVVQMRPGARTDVGPPLRFLTSGRSEERRVGKECRYRGAREALKEKSVRLTPVALHAWPDVPLAS